jgi:hypothetical protein
MTIEKRVAIQPIFARPPQQSDYVPQWGHKSQLLGHPQSRYFAPSPAWWRRVPPPVKSLKYFLQRTFHRDGIARGFNPSQYRRVDEAALLRAELGVAGSQGRLKTKET